ncbi:hypothetical protein CkaCkLH20_10140 [Colletotrichum karsti]|uniref:Rhodopsin domain-containing protein n=1 Tax=Colletotrichum karsti TaxID=1095194 RepID=A0A9P6HWU9_9PEZI|nr:uncharacterized protein CkaCkLH20_10140 [Colletotrichum karsti]KAF9872313.1 hypothetical protein CkaCkLH20_10140 [Colletotrichum karsti]
MDGKMIHDLFGTQDNSQEPEPLVNKTSTILGVAISFQVISWLAVALRMYTRARMVRSLGWDDLFVVLALFSTTTGTVGTCVATKYGLGKHLVALSRSDVQNYLRTFYIANASYQMSTAFIKLSLLFQYLRIFDEPCFLRRVCICTIIFTSLWAAAYTVLGWIPCVPVRAYWDWTVPAARWAYGSLNAPIFYATYASHSSVNVFLDLVVLAIPVPLYFKRDAPLKSKLGLLALLTVGLVVNAISVVRLLSLVQHKAATQPTLDFPWYAPISIVLSCVEVDLAMVACSVPIFWPVIRKFTDGIFVTKEVEVTREVRRLESVELDDDLDMEADRRSRVGSEASLRQETLAPVARGRYLDEFVAQQVDPLSRSKSVVTQIKTGEVDDAKWWQKGRLE